MKRFFLSLLLLCADLSSSAQITGVRLDNVAYSAAGGTVSVIPQPQVTVCTSSSTVANCNLNKVTTYSDGTLSTPCPASAQVTLTQTTSCVATGDAQGNFGFWVPAGTYAYMVSGSGAATKLYVFSGNAAGSSSGIVGTPIKGSRVEGNGASFVSQPAVGYDAGLYGVVCDGATDTTAAMGALLVIIGATPAKLIMPSGKCLLRNVIFPATLTLDFSAGGSIQTITSTTLPGNAAFVQGSGTEAGATTTCSVTLNNTVAGNAIVFMAAPYPGFTYSFNVPTDTGSNSYVLVQQSLVNQPRNVGAWVASNIAGGTVTITATATGTLAHSQCMAHEYSGLGPVVAADGQGVSNNSTGATMSSGSVTTTAGSLLVSYGGGGLLDGAETCTAGAGYIQPAAMAGQTTNGYLCAQYKLSSAGGATSATQTLSVNPSPSTWVYNLLALKPGSATITVKGGIIDPDLHQIFYNATGTAGVIDFTGNSAIEKLYPEYWGASPAASAAVNTPALQAWEHGMFGTNRSNASGLSKWNKQGWLSGNYSINGELQFYHVTGFKIGCAERLNAGITQTAANQRIIDGQSIAYGEFDSCKWSTTAAQTVPLLDLDYDGTQGADLAPQHIDFYSNVFGGGSLGQIGLLISKSGGAAQGSNINLWNPQCQDFTEACEQIGGNNAGINAGRLFAQNAIINEVWGGNFSGNPHYGIAVYGGHINVHETSFEDGFTSQTGFDVYCEAPQLICLIDHVRSESRRLAAGNPIRIVNSHVIDSAAFPTPGQTFPVFPAASSIIKGSVVGGNGAWYKVTAQASAFGGVGTPTTQEAATSGSATTIAKAGAAYTVNAFTGFLASILGGTGYGEYCLITSNTATTITCTAGWTTKFFHLPIVNPDATSTYVVEPNWGTQFTSGGMTWADMSENGIEGAPAGGACGSCILENVDVPGDKINIGSNTILKNVTVTRPDWMVLNGGSAGGLNGNVVLSSYDVYLDPSVLVGAVTYYQPWSFPRTGVTPFSYPMQNNLGTKPICWSAGNPIGPASAREVCIGGRDDPNSANSVSRGIFQILGTVGRATPFGTDQAGTDMDVQGGLPTGAGAPGSINFWTGTAGGSSANVADGTKRWQITAAGHLFPFVTNTYDLGAAANTVRTGYFGTSVVTPSITLGGIVAGAPPASALHGVCKGVATANSTNGVAVTNLGGDPSVNTCLGSTAVQMWGTVLTHACTLRNFYVHAGTAGKDATDAVMTLQQNATALGITCVVGNTTACNDTTHTQAAVAGDMIWVKGSTEAATTLADVSVSVDCQ